jgi:hypothetical protein
MFVPVLIANAHLHRAPWREEQAIVFGVAVQIGHASSHKSVRVGRRDRHHISDCMWQQRARLSPLVLLAHAAESEPHSLGLRRHDRPFGVFGTATEFGRFVSV